MHVSEAHTSQEMRFNLHTESAYAVADWALRQLEGWVENQVEGRWGADGGESEDDAKPDEYRPHVWPETWPTLEEKEGHASVLVIPRRLYADAPPSGAFANTLWAIIEDLVERACPAGDDEAPCGEGEQAAARELMAMIGPAPEGRAPETARYILKEGKGGEWGEPHPLDDLTGDMDFESMEEISAIHRLNVGDVLVLGEYYWIKRVE